MHTRGITVTWRDTEGVKRGEAKEKDKKANTFGGSSPARKLMSEFLSFLRMNNILFIYLSVNGHFGWFYL